MEHEDIPLVAATGLVVYGGYSGGQSVIVLSVSMENGTAINLALPCEVAERIGEAIAAGARDQLLRDRARDN